MTPKIIDTLSEIQDHLKEVDELIADLPGYCSSHLRPSFHNLYIVVNGFLEDEDAT